MIKSVFPHQCLPLIALFQADSVAEMAGFPPSTLIDRLMKSLKTGSFEKMQVCITDILAEGFSVIHILTQLFEKVSFSSFILQYM